MPARRAITSGTLDESQIIHCDGKSINLVNRYWHVLKTILLSGGIPKLIRGVNTIRVAGNFWGATTTIAKLELRSMGESLLIRK
jgi:ABC-type anion transport system duplicated permease subunit